MILYLARVAPMLEITMPPIYPSLRRQERARNKGKGIKGQSYRKTVHVVIFAFFGYIHQSISTATTAAPKSRDTFLSPSIVKSNSFPKAHDADQLPVFRNKKRPGHAKKTSSQVAHSIPSHGDKVQKRSPSVAEAHNTHPPHQHHDAHKAAQPHA